MQIRLSTTLDAPPDWVATHLQSTAVFRSITAPLLRFQPAHGTTWPARWAPGETQLRMQLLGVVPLGRHTVRISVHPRAPGGGDWPTLRDNGEGTLLRRWDHRITWRALPDGRTLYTDEVAVAARHLPLLMTPVAAAFAHVFYRHRQRRWRRLAQRHSAAGSPPLPSHRRAAFEYLLDRFARSAGALPHERWRWLEAAHVLGQPSFPLHWYSHVAMLRHAMHLRDRREVAGQLARLALTPVGHLLARLPRGNIGRAHVNAFRAMVPAAEVTALVQAALDATEIPPAYL